MPPIEGSCDHYAVLTQVQLSAAGDEATTRSIWLWEEADWPSLRQALRLTDWGTLLRGGAEHKAQVFTEHILTCPTPKLHLQATHGPPLLWLWMPPRC